MMTLAATLVLIALSQSWADEQPRITMSQADYYAWRRVHLSAAIAPRWRLYRPALFTQGQQLPPVWLASFDYAENGDYSEEFNLLNCLNVRGLLAGDAKNYPAGIDDYWCSAY